MAHTVRTIITRSVLFSSLLKVLSFFKVSYVVGSLSFFFSATHALMPLTGVFGGLATTTLVLAFGTLSKLFFGVSCAPYLITYHIPSFMASAYWAHKHWSIRVTVPLVCMILFVMHPVGMLAAPYTLYWLIPVIVHIASMRSIFAQSLGSTMIAHAVGSVMWLYTIPMTPAYWYALIPVVAVERLLFATAMTLAYYALAQVFAYQGRKAVQQAVGIAESL
jgi:hypothetical protein